MVTFFSCFLFLFFCYGIWFWVWPCFCDTKYMLEEFCNSFSIPGGFEFWFGCFISPVYLFFNKLNNCLTCKAFELCFYIIDFFNFLVPGGWGRARSGLIVLSVFASHSPLCNPTLQVGKSILSQICGPCKQRIFLPNSWEFLLIYQAVIRPDHVNASFRSRELSRVDTCTWMLLCHHCSRENFVLECNESLFTHP